MKYLILLIPLLLVACNPEPELPVYTQEEFADVAPVNITQESGEYVKCRIGQLDFYATDTFIYHINDLRGKVVYAPAGEYIKPKDYPRWQLRTYLDKEDSTYTITRTYIEDRKLPNGEEIVCESTDKLPLIFQNFIKTHEGLYKKEAIEFD